MTAYLTIRLYDRDGRTWPGFHDLKLKHLAVVVDRKHIPSGKAGVAAQGRQAHRS